MNNRIFTLVDDNGELIEYFLLSIIELDNKKYAIYTDGINNDVEFNSYASEIVKINNEFTLKSINDKEILNSIKIKFKEELKNKGKDED